MRDGGQLVNWQFLEKVVNGDTCINAASHNFLLLSVWSFPTLLPAAPVNEPTNPYSLEYFTPCRLQKDVALLQQNIIIVNIVVVTNVINFINFHLQDEFCAAVDDLKTRERTSNEGIKEINYDCPETEQLYGIGYHKVIQIKHLLALDCMI